MQELLLNDAWSIAMELMTEHGLPLPEGGLAAHSAATEEAAGKLFQRRPSHTLMIFEVETLRVRASFSNIPLWHALMGDVEMVSVCLGGNDQCLELDMEVN